MLFNSWPFALFFPLVTLGYFLLPHRARWAWLLAASCGFYMAFVPAYILILAVTIATDYAAGLLIAASAPESWISRLLSAPPLVAIGILSYGLYLWHYPAAVFFRERLPWYETVPTVLALAFLAATLSHLAIERPLQGFRRRLRPKRSTEPADSDDAVALLCHLPNNELNGNELILHASAEGFG